MSRYIDAESLEKSVNNWLFNINTYYHPHSKRTTIPTSEVFDLIKTEPTADVVEVVRCKDCEFWQSDWIPNTGGDRGCHYCEMMDSFTEPLNYCGYGERKEGQQ